MRNRRYVLVLFALVLMTSSVLFAAPLNAPFVDEPLGARYSLGVTLWHLGHNAEMIANFHAFLKKEKLTPEQLLPATALKPPANMTRILLEPELLGEEKLNGWKVDVNRIVSGAGDTGPTVAIPLHVPHAGLYRLWVQYYANPNSRGVTFLKLYRTGQEEQGLICQPDEFYDQPSATPGPAWKDLLVDLPAGDVTIKIGHVTRWWQGGGGYDLRQVDCFYMTDELWATPPDAVDRKAMRLASKPEGIQWTVNAPLAKTDLPTWQWWQIRPLSWEDAAANPRLFDLSRNYWKGIVEELSAKEYDEKKLPDYREMERQVIYVDNWNMVTNPVRARRQITTLTKDISRVPLGAHYVWHDIGSHIQGLDPQGKYDPNGPYAKYGAWYGGPGHLGAGYGTGTGTVATAVPVTVPGKYTVWVLSSSNNLYYTAPWFGKVSVDGKEQFIYYHKGKITSIWMRMGEVTVQKPGDVKVEFILDGAEAGGTYRNIYTLFLVDDPKIVPQGTIRPPWTMPMYRERAAKAGAKSVDKLLVWLSDDPYRPLSQEVWAESYSPGDSWPYTPQTGTQRVKEILQARDCCRAVQVGLRNLTDAPLALKVEPGPLTGKAGAFPNAVSWRVEAFVPYGTDRQQWIPFFLMRRPNITVPPLNVAGVWLTVNSKGVPAGDYQSAVRISGQGMPPYTVLLKVRVSAIRPEPKQPILLDGWTQPWEGEAYMRDFVEHGFNVWPGEMSKADMQKWGIRQVRLSRWAADGTKEWVENLKKLGLDYSDYFVGIMDEPCGTTEAALKPYLDVAKAIKAVDPKIRVSFNPAEAAQLATFQVLAPYCDTWCPYVLHVFSPYYGNPEKKKIYTPKPWMWYTTPDLWDKTARDPGIRTVPSQPGDCVGVSFFALNYPFRDQWDTAYEYLADASTMGALFSRHGPVPVIVYEQMREVSATANLAMMVRERLGVKTFDEVTDPAMQKLIKEGSQEELIRWLEEHPVK